MTDKKSMAYLQIHFCVFLWGFTAILGKLISLNTIPLVFWRVLLACLLLLFLFSWQQFRAVPRRVLWQMFGIGCLVGLHWMCFYGSIKLANASVALATMSTTSFFAAFVEPVFFKKKIKWYEVGLGALVLPGMVLVGGSLDFSLYLGFFVGILSGFLCSIFATFNKKIVMENHPPPMLMSFVELFGVTFLTGILLPFLLFFSPGENFLPQNWDWGWLILLAWVCTVLPFSLSLKTMKHLSAFSINLSLNLEPVYGIFMAGAILHEHKELSLNFYLGVGIILLAVLSHPFLTKFFEKER